MDLLTKRLWLQSLVPHYRSKWCAQTEVFNYWLNQVVEEFHFSMDGRVPIAKNKTGLVLRGFDNVARDKRLAIKTQFEKISKNIEYFRLMSDIVTRYYFPHLQPTVSPMIFGNPTVDQSYMEGFHGQHREAFDLSKNVKANNLLGEVFRVKKTDIILDVGSFIGFGALATSKHNPNGKIISIEADGDCYELLRKNVEDNDAKLIVPINAAVWNESGVEKSLASGGTQANSLLPHVIKQSTQNHSYKLVLTKKIDDIVEELKLENVDMISLTINGAEPEAIMGAQKTLKKYRPRLRFAGWYKIGDRTVASICKPMLKEIGYHVAVSKNNGVLACAVEDLQNSANRNRVS